MDDRGDKEIERGCDSNGHDGVCPRHSRTRLLERGRFRLFPFLWQRALENLFYNIYNEQERFRFARCPLGLMFNDVSRQHETTDQGASSSGTAAKWALLPFMAGRRRLSPGTARFRRPSAPPDLSRAIWPPSVATHPSPPTALLRGREASKAARGSCWVSLCHSSRHIRVNVNGPIHAHSPDVGAQKHRFCATRRSVHEFCVSSLCIRAFDYLLPILCDSAASREPRSMATQVLIRI